MEHDAAILVEDAPWGSSTDPAYVIPRGNVFVVGGTYYENNTETKLSENERKRLVENADLLGIDTSITSPVSEWAGFRPVRQTVRMEIDEKFSSESKLRIVHSYGHGGSGWTTYVGAAKEVAELLCS
jgi:D-amino-acid oxidase